MIQKIGQLSDKEIIKSLIQWLDDVNWDKFQIEGDEKELKIKRVI